MIYRGENSVKGIYRGETPIKKVYRGETLIWSATPQEPEFTPVDLFMETFPNPGTSDYSLTNVNWTVVVALGATSTVSNYVSSAEGKGPNIPLNAGYAAGTDTTKGLIYRGSSRETMFFTRKYAPDRALYGKLKFSCYVGHSVLGLINYFVVEVNGAWYATNQTFTQPTAVASASTFSVDAMLYETEINLATALWHPISYTVDVTLSLDFNTAVALPAGAITGIGLYARGDNAGTNRMDSFGITATAAA